MVGGHNTNMAAAVRRFITNQPPCPHFNGHWKIPASFNPNFPLRGQEPFLCKLLSITIISWVNFPFPASSLHLSSPCSSWCSEYFLIQPRLSPATRGPVVRGKTRHRFSIYPPPTTHQLPPCQQCLTGTRYPTRPDNFWQYPIRTRFFSRIIGYFGYRVFHFFWPDVPVTV